MKASFKKSILLMLITASSALSYGKNEINIIPQPVSVKLLTGEFALTANSAIISKTDISNQSAKIFSEYILQNYGFKINLEKNNTTSNQIILLVKPQTIKGSHSIKINKKNIQIEGDECGIFYAFQSLKQLVKESQKGTLVLPCAEIMDYPRYDWRGMHLDVGRHFMTKDSVKKYIDYIAMYKMNVFHWHLTEDQGWRIEIKKYPKLTEIGAYREGTLIGHYTPKNQRFDTIRHGGFYTQEDIKEVVKYAQERQITVVPEIEMPGHALAALAAYPEYSCTGGPFKVGMIWGVINDVLCPKEETFTFIENILNEVMTLFPGEYIHIGGDECPKTRWKRCAACQIKIKELGLKDEHGLQSYFITRVEKMVNAKGKKIIGWDEILEGGLAPNAAVMSWRGIEGGIAAANESHYVVMTPGTHCYFDHYQGNPKTEPLAIGGFLTLEKVYSYEPTPAALPADKQKYVMGAQGNIWTEYMPTFKAVEYMAFPRICALSEVLWSPVSTRNLVDFKVRLRNHFSILDLLKINYSKANVDAK